MISPLLLLLGCNDYFLDGASAEVRDVTVTESFTQAPLPGLDVLFVVDGTGSMAEEQAMLGDAAVVFVSALDDLDVAYQIGVVSMDLADQGALLGVPWILTPSQDDVAGNLAEAMNVGTSALPPSQGLDAATLVLSDPLGVNTGFRRADAALHVLFVTDADDSSGDVLGDDPVTAFLAVLAAEQNRTARGARASALVGDLPGGCTGDNGTALAGTRYVEVAEGSGGKVASICTGDFGSLVTDMGAVAVEWQVSFPLQADPAEGSAAVWVDGERMESGWALDHSVPALVFEAAPPPDAWIEVTYSLGDTGA